MRNNSQFFRKRRIPLRGTIFNFQFLSRCLATVFFISAVAAFSPIASAAHTTSSYVIQLKSSQELPRLESVAQSVEHEFAFSQNPEFGNIYSFFSVLPLSTLQRKLSGTYIYLEPNYEYYEGSVTVNDPGFTDNYQNIDRQWGLSKAGFTDAWSQTVGAATNVVAVIDTGIDATHQDLQAVNFVSGYDFLSEVSLTGKINSDDNGHGTLVAGVLGATVNNGIGIAGTNWQISLMPLKALDSNGKGDSSNVAQAIVWAADHGANIINLSLGGIGFVHDTTLSNAIAYAFNKNEVIVAAAGNDVAKDGGNMDQNPVFPVCDDNDQNMVIGVAATDQNDLKTDFSNYGKNCIDVAAPGKRILSTINFDPVTKQSAPNSYAFASGTSLAAPFVSGEAALILAKNPNLTNAQVRDRILASADPIDSLNSSQCGGNSCSGLLGAGRINVYKALNLTNDFAVANEGDIVKAADTGAIYQISGGQKRLISTFVLNQRFSTSTVKTLVSQQLNSFPSGSYVAPLDGTLVKVDGDQTVYEISKGLRLPVTYQVFLQRHFQFSSVNTVGFAEFVSWATGSFLPPVDGSLVKSANKPTVYWVVGQALHPVNANFFNYEGLKIFPILTVADNDIASFPKGEAYIR